MRSGSVLPAVGPVDRGWKTVFQPVSSRVFCGGPCACPESTAAWKTTVQDSQDDYLPLERPALHFRGGAPVEEAFAPGPDEAFGEEEEENHGGDERLIAKPEKRHGEG